MSVSLTPYMRAVAEAENPEKEIRKWIGNLKDINLIGDRCLVATYARPNRTEGGVFLSDNISLEDRFQGTVGLLVALGPTAFKYDGSYSFEGEAPKVGDWLIYRPADGFEIAFRKASCRLIRSESIFGKIKDPLLVF